MSQSYIILTQTFVDKNVLMMMIASYFFQTQKLDFNLSSIQNTKTTELQEVWSKYQSSGQIIVPELVAKKDFTENVFSFYKSYPNPSLLFLGDLNEFSIPAQEGMLKLLEEPPKNLIVILFSKDRSNILDTISSRCNFYNIPHNLVLRLLDQNMLNKTQTKLPKATDFINQWISLEPLSLPDPKNIEREEIEFWLWQLGVYLEIFYKKNPHQSYLEKIIKITEAKKLNSQKVQKKFVLGWLK